MLPDKEKRAREMAIEKLMDLIDDGDAEDIKGLRMKPVAEMSVTKVSPLHDEPDGDEGDDDAQDMLEDRNEDEDDDGGKLGELRRALRGK